MVKIIHSATGLLKKSWERNAFGEKMTDGAIERAAEIMNYNRKLIKKIQIFDEEAKLELERALKERFEKIEKVNIETDYIRVDPKPGASLSGIDIFEIEKATGFCFQYTTDFGDYIFYILKSGVNDVKGSELDNIKRSEYLDEIRELEKYIREGENAKKSVRLSPSKLKKEYFY